MNRDLDIEYNTDRPKMQIPEYGRNVQKMVNFAVTIEDREERNRVAKAIINVMGELKQHLRDEEDYNHKLWTHMFIMSDFKLDVDSPYPIPDKEFLAEKPNKVNYPQSDIRFGHYGKTVEKLLDEACKMEDGEKKDALVKIIANIMKKFHLAFHTNSVDDDIIAQHLKKLSKGKIEITDVSFLTPTKDILRTIGVSTPTNTNRSNNNANRNRNKNKNRNRNNNNQNKKRF